MVIPVFRRSGKTILYNMNVSPKWLVNCSIEPRTFLITVYLNETTGKVVFIFVASEVNLTATHYHINSVSALHTEMS